MAEPITQARLRALAAVHPDQGRVLSVFLNLDPAQFATPNARSSAITSVITAAAHKVEESDGLSHDERMALRDDVERVREVLVGSDIAANGTRAVAVYACGPEDLLEVVRLRRPGREPRGARPHGVRRAAGDAGHRRALDGAAHQPPRRAAVLRPRRLAGGDRPDRRRRALPARSGRLVAAQLPALGGEGGLRPPRAHGRAGVRPLQEARRRPRADRRAGRADHASSRASCTRT